MNNRFQHVVQLILTDHRLGHLQKHRSDVGLLLPGFQQANVFNRHRRLMHNPLQNCHAVLIQHRIAQGIQIGMVPDQKCPQNFAARL